jgi:sorbitol-specific phosphotransferase system component IIC
LFREISLGLNYQVLLENFQKIKKGKKEERKLSVYIGVITGVVTVPLTLTPLAV